MAKTVESAWVPSNALEEEVVSLQPYHDFIYGSNFAQTGFYSAPLRPKTETISVEKRRELEELKEQLLKPLPTDQRDKLSAIIKTQNVLNTKPLGEMPTIDDWNGNKQTERETIHMMRKLQLGPSTERPLNSERTIGTVSTTEEYKLVKTKKGSLPVFLSEDFFKLSPVSFEQEESEELQISESTAATEESISVPDLITFNTTESSYSSPDEKSRKTLNEISYRVLCNSTNSSSISESSYGYDLEWSLADYIKKAPRRNKKNRKTQQKN